MRYEIAVVIFTYSILLFGCKNISSQDAEFISDPVNGSTNVTTILSLINQSPCGSIEIYPGVPFYNVTGQMTARTKEGSVLHMTTVKDLTYNNSIYAAEQCFPIWRVKLNNTRNFLITDVPPGKYVISLPSYRFVNSQGFPALDKSQDENYELVIAFFGGDSRYSLIVFEIRASNFTEQEKLV